ncbi:MAG: rod shape-determining protein MreC [Pseudomonadota bacterium]
MPSGSNGVHRLSHGRALGLRTFILSIFCIGLMMIDLRGDMLRPARELLMSIAYPLQTVAATPASLLNWSDDSGRSRAELALENARLKRERLLSDARLQQLNAIAAENDRLRAMLDARPRVGADMRVAQIIDVDTDRYRHRVVLNKGANQEIATRQAIVDANGIVGQVIEVGPFSSNVMLISDPGHAIPVEVVRNGLRTVAFGAGEYDQLDVRYLPNNADVVVGDLLVTTSLGGDFPPGYPVAEITAVDIQPRQEFAKVTATPVAALTQIREVLVLASRQPITDTEDEDGQERE